MDENSQIQNGPAILNDMAESLKTEVDLYPVKDGLPTECSKTLHCIESLLLPCNDMSRIFDTVSSQLVHNNELSEKAAQDNDKSLSLQDKRTAVQSQWNGIRRLFYCADTHLKNAAAYHRFFFESRELQKQMKEYQSDTSDLFWKKPSKVNDITDLKVMVQETKVLLRKMRTWDGAVVDLSERSRLIVPVNIRTEPLTKPLLIRALCGYKTSKIRVEEGEPLTLLDNKDFKNWKVETGAGLEGELPAVTCVIPPPASDVIADALQLRQTLEDDYSRTVMIFKQRLVSGSLEILDHLIKCRDQYQNISVEQKKKIEETLMQINEPQDKLLNGYENYPVSRRLSIEFNSLLNHPVGTGHKHDDKAGSEVLDMLHVWFKWVKNLEELHENSEIFQLYRYRIVRDEKTVEIPEDKPATVTTTPTANLKSPVVVEKYGTPVMDVHGHYHESFVVDYVIAPDNSRIDYDKAKQMGYIDLNTGFYYKHGQGKNKRGIPIRQAIQEGYIAIQSTEVKQEHERIFRKRRPSVYKVKDSQELSVKKDLVSSQRSEEDNFEHRISEVLDVKADCWLPFAQAVMCGVITNDATIFINTKKDQDEQDKRLTINDAIQKDYIRLTHDADIDESVF